MIRHFCDVCENEITDGNHTSIIGVAALRTLRNRRRSLAVEIAISPPAGEDSIELCRPCAFAAVIQLSPERLVVAEEVDG